MGKKLDQIIVIDVESTCWQGPPPAGQESEIIEVGICILEVASGERLEKRSILVKPERSKVSDFCTKLTTLTQEQVDKGVDFPNACSILRNKYSSKDRIWASYGDYDRRQFEKQCGAKKLTYPFGFTHINVKNLFAVVHAFPEEVGMDTAMELLDLPLEGTHHRGADDAWNVAAILSKLLLQSRT
ncbi:exonuclease domain-containing protein [Microcoleus sp. FACHB-831]|uniref:3'-5' exonuclease n=1 Tax=Microcoleus sp. FACHB-831 TaxID=2692827 RepID=UPI001683764A|nr:3'-5' exonuclease [Microcoleus sp. FACHB-831]MBD1924497.1 exonuclease domain-containing protein [Microcoleus sp. FACHB-831]